MPKFKLFLSDFLMNDNSCKILGYTLTIICPFKKISWIIIYAASNCITEVPYLQFNTTKDVSV